MCQQRGFEVQRGRGIGSTLRGLYKSVFPLARAGVDAGKRVMNSNFAKNVGKQALHHGLHVAKNAAVDMLGGSAPSQAASHQLLIAKKKVAEAVRGRGKSKRKKQCDSDCESDCDAKPVKKKKSRKSENFNLFDD